MTSLKKADKLLIVCIMILSILLLIPLVRTKENANVVVVKVKQKEVMRLDLNQDKEVSVQGTNGQVVIEVKDHKVRVKEENSPRHICSYQGYVSSPNTPIICLPNDTVIEIQSEESSEDVVIQ